jgi:hypothetical protein
MYLTNNLLAIIFGLGAILLGNVYDIPQLSGISGTIFCIYLLQKYCELMPYRVEFWAWSTLFLGIILYVGNMYLRHEFENGGWGKYFHVFPTYEITAE